MSKNKFNLTLPPVEPDPSPTQSPGETATVVKSTNLVAAIGSGKPITQASGGHVVIPSVIE